MINLNDLSEIAQLPLVTKIHKGEVAVKSLAMTAVYDNSFKSSRHVRKLECEQGDEVYVYENALGAHYAAFMTAGSFRYQTRINPGVDVIITRKDLYYV